MVSGGGNIYDDVPVADPFPRANTQAKILRRKHIEQLRTWKELQLRTHEWVHLEEIIKWCARRPGSIDWSEDRSSMG